MVGRRRPGIPEMDRHGAKEVKFLDQLLDMARRNTQIEEEKVDRSKPPIFDDVDEWYRETAALFNERSEE